METKLNKKQLNAINANDPQIVIIAPAGSGKTTTLVAAIKKYKEENPMNTVVAITFTRKAADDLKNKIGAYGGVSTSTIHSWAYQELDKLANLVAKEDPNNAFKVKLLQDEKIKEILEKICRDRGYRYIKIWQVFLYVMGNYNIDVPDSLKRVFESIKKEYVEYKIRMGLYDFTDLPQYLLDKLLDYGKEIEGIDALFVDEFQDVDDIQLELFNRVPAEKKFYIGDPKQSIYIFRGATEDVLKRLEDFAIYNLDINYRSNQEIIDFATTYQNAAQNDAITFSTQLESYRSSILCENGYGGHVYILGRTGLAYQVNEPERLKGEDIVKTFMARQPMILCRKNKEVKEIQDLGYSRVQTVHQAKGLEYDTVIVTDFDIQSLEDINISYVAMTRAETHLLAANYEAFIKILSKLKKDGTLMQNLF